MARLVGLGGALLENRFFSETVRIQKERRLYVISTGPYAWIRHPGSAGALLTYFVTPFLLDSPWAFVPVIFMTIVLIIRTFLEDRTLQNELTGYKEISTQKNKVWIIAGYFVIMLLATRPLPLPRALV